jgi:hypothetical protein
MRPRSGSSSHAPTMDPGLLDWRRRAARSAAKQADLGRPQSRPKSKPAGARGERSPQNRGCGGSSAGLGEGDQGSGAKAHRVHGGGKPGGLRAFRSRQPSSQGSSCDRVNHLNYEVSAHPHYVNFHEIDLESSRCAVREGLVAERPHKGSDKGGVWAQRAKEEHRRASAPLWDLQGTRRFSRSESVSSTAVQGVSGLLPEQRQVGIGLESTLHSRPRGAGRPSDRTGRESRKGCFAKEKKIMEERRKAAKADAPAKRPRGARVLAAPHQVGGKHLHWQLGYPRR